METENSMVELLKDIKGLLSQQKKVMNIDDLVAYTGLSKSKIYKLTQLKLIPMWIHRSMLTPLPEAV